MLKRIRTTLVAGLAALAAAEAWAGHIHARLEEKLRAAGAGEAFAVIVEMKDQVRPASLPAKLPRQARRARLNAVIAALKDGADRSQAALRAELAQQQSLGAVRRARPFWIFNGFAVTADEHVIRRLAARDDVLEVRLDELIPPPPRPASAAPGTTNVEWNIGLIRAPEVWALKPDYNGTGAVVGSFDTGVDFSHEDLFAGYRGNEAISWFDPYGEHSMPYDFHGHGTHTTGTAVGGNADGSHIGVAPGAKWIAAKAWADDGTGFVSDFHRIFEWFLAPGGDTANAPDVVINSWALLVAGCSTEFQPDIQAWRDAGIFPVFAAGNAGPRAGSARSPGALAEAFAVGATDMFDEVAAFSSRGPSPCGGAPKPDISAPGDGVRSSVPGGYGTLSGTSMATPHVAGAVAVLRSIDPDMSIDDLANVLKLGATDIADPGPDNNSGAGRLDLFVSAEIAIHGADTPLVRVVATQPIATEAGPTPGTLTFSRTGNTDAPLQVKFSVGGTATPGSDYVPIPVTVVIPAGSASAAIQVMPIDDAVLEFNETVSVTLTPDDAYIAAGSRVAAVIIVSNELFPDLVVSALSAPARAGAGQSITLTETTTNRGGGAAAVASITRYFLSADATLDGADPLLGSRQIPALAPGAGSPASLVVTIPDPTPPGTWYLIASADATGVIGEDQEANNFASRAIQIGADLTVSVLSVPANAGAGQTITISDTTKNQGGGTAGPSVTQYFLSPTSILGASAVSLGIRSVPALQSEATDAGAITITLPGDLTTGNWYVIAKADGTQAVPEFSETNNLTTRLIRVGADLSIPALTVPATAAAGQSATITDTTQNADGASAGPSVTHYYLSSNSILEVTNDVLIGSRDVPALGAGESSTGSVVLTFPADAAPGTWYLIAKADALDAVIEVLESNNTAFRAIKFGPDLTLTALTAPSTAGPGQAITISESTNNTGGGPADASVTSYFLSANVQIDAGDVPLGSRNVPALAGGTSSIGSVLVSIPVDTAVGTWYLLARADSEQVVSETAETNNTSSRSIKIGADLSVSALSTPTTTGAGQSVTITDTTTNQGGGTAPPSTTRYFLSPDTVLDPSDPLIGSRDVPALPAGVSSTGSTLATVPPGTATAAWYVIAQADGTQVVVETSKANNTYRRVIQIGPDLIVSALTVPATAAAAQTLSVTDTTNNQGGGAVEASQTQYFLSANSTLDATDQVVGVRSVPALAPGTSHTGSTQVTIPAGTLAATWYLIARADGPEAVVETSEGNNIIARPVQVGADLTVPALTSPATAAAGQGITVTDTTKNPGGGPVEGSQTQFFLSSNATFDTSDTLLGSREVPALAAGTSSIGSTLLTIPATVSTGNWYLIAKADGPELIAESAETNNTSARAIKIGADLMVFALTAPANAVAGQSLTITDTTKNQGGGPAEVSQTQFFLSSNPVLDASDLLVGSREVPALAAGATSIASTQLTIPATISTGNWYLIAKADGQELVVETTETNNSSARLIKITAP